MMAWLLGYDIGENRHRRRCLRALRGLAEGYQKSVFEVQARPEEIRATLGELAEPLQGHDSLLAARILPFAHAWQLGRGASAPQGELIIIR